MIQRYKKHIAIAVIAFLAPWVALIVKAIFTPLPPELRQGAEASDHSIVIRDREGALLRQVRNDQGELSRWVKLNELGPYALDVLIAAEDKRFFYHPGIDPMAMTRAAVQWLIHRRIVSGASTITQQLARTVVPRPRTLAGKFSEMALALRIEWSLSKREIAEQYFNRVAFGPNIRGIEAASRYYFDKSTADLSLGETATLVSIPRGPTYYDPKKHVDRLRVRRDVVLKRLPSNRIDSGVRDRALNEPTMLFDSKGTMGASHFIRALLASKFSTLDISNAREITTTLNRELQREAEIAVQRTMNNLRDRHVTAASVVVLDNKSGDILAYVGSPNILNEANLGHNDGVLALRQPGSSLKPFIYALAIEKKRYRPTTILPDIAMTFPTAGGQYEPHNYDERFHGPVLLREALANSYNVPAVYTTSTLGVDRVLGQLHEFGFTSLTQSPEHYGVAIALGDGEVRLLDLASAYATFAREGLWKQVRAVQEVKRSDGIVIVNPNTEERRILSVVTASLITDILSDKNARISSFGRGNILEFPFDVAAKTGTSKSFRDNVTVGYNSEVTVAVWVGNFDGSAMEGVSGISGAGPIFREVMLTAARIYPPKPFVLAEELEKIEVCSLSGDRPTQDCPHKRTDLRVRSDEESKSCSMHVHALVDRITGLRVNENCASGLVESRVFESFPEQYADWAIQAKRNIVPTLDTLKCPMNTSDSSKRLEILYPVDGSQYSLDPALHSRQSVVVKIAAPTFVDQITVWMDGKAYRKQGRPLAVEVPLAVGTHLLYAEAAGVGKSDSIEIQVR